MRVLILGGTGVISRCIVEELLARNYEVVLFNRGSKNLPFSREVEHIQGNKENVEEFQTMMRNQKFDVVIDMICFNKNDAKTTVDVFRNQVEQLVFCSSVAAYKRPYKNIPTGEDEELTTDPTFGYSFHKAEAERYLQKEMRENLVPITIIRPSLTFGIGAANIGVLRQNAGIVDRMRKGKPLVMFGDGTTPWIFTFAPDLAKGFAGVLGNKKTYGQAYHVTSDEVHIWKDLYLEMGKVIGMEPKIVYLPSQILMKAAPDLCSHLFFEKTHAGLFDNAKIKRDVPGYKAEISLHEGLKDIIHWYEESHYPLDPVKEKLEDQLVAAYYELERKMTGLY